jgi:hypothetical protein
MGANMKIIPSQLVHPRPAPGLAWARLIRSIHDVSLSSDPVSGEFVDPDKELQVLDGQYLVMGFREHESSPVSHVLVKASPQTVLPAVVADQRHPGLWIDGPSYRASLDSWAPGLDNLRKAEKNVLFAFALRITFELSQPKPQPKPDETAPI